MLRCAFNNWKIEKWNEQTMKNVGNQSNRERESEKESLSFNTVLSTQHILLYSHQYIYANHKFE